MPYLAGLSDLCNGRSSKPEEQQIQVLRHLDKVARGVPISSLYSAANTALNSFEHDGKSPKKVQLVEDFNKMVAMQVYETTLEH